MDDEGKKSKKKVKGSEKILKVKRTKQTKKIKRLTEIDSSQDEKTDFETLQNIHEEDSPTVFPEQTSFSKGYIDPATLKKDLLEYSGSPVEEDKSEIGEENVIKERRVYKRGRQSWSGASTGRRQSKWEEPMPFDICENPTTYEEHYDWADEKITSNPLIEIVTREWWGAAEPLSENPVDGPPLSKVALFYTGMEPCFTKQECCAVVRQMQELYMGEKKLADIPWNFLIGCDGRVYEGRGWGVHPKKVNSLYKYRQLEYKSYDVAYIGPYFRARNDPPDEKSLWPKLSFTQPMFLAFKCLIEIGVKNNFIDDDFGVVSQVGC